MPLATWVADGWRTLPPWRIDLGGEMEQPLTIQWAEPPDKLARYLSTRGWRQPVPLDLKNLMGMLSPDTPVEKLPVLPRLHDGRTERLRLVHSDPKGRLVLRLWPTDVEIAENSTPLLIGTIEEQGRRQWAGFLTVSRDTGEYDRSLFALEQEIHNRFSLKRVTREISETQIDHDDYRFRWQSRVLLVWGEKGG
jgi:hypothetical protein